MGAGGHYEFWVFPKSKTWGLFLGNSRHNSELLSLLLIFSRLGFFFTPTTGLIMQPLKKPITSITPKKSIKMTAVSNFI